MENNNPIRFRTITGALSQLKKDDPNTCITYAIIRKLCDDGKIQFIKHGNRFIINYDNLINYLEGKD